jgi:hypothetical protein
MARLRRSRLALPTLLGLAVLCAYLFSASSDLRHNGDTDLRYQTTQAIVDHAQLWIHHPLWSDTRVARGLGGHLYAFYAPGQAILMVPFYVAGKVIAHHLSLPYDVTTLYAARSLDLVLGALLAFVFFLFAVSLRYPRGVAALLTLIFAFATAAWPDAQSALEQTQVDLFVLIASLALWTWLKHGMKDRRWLVVCAAGAGAALCTRYDAAVFVPVFAALILGFRWSSGPSRRQALIATGVFLLSIAPWLLALGGWNAARFGSPFLTGLHEQTFGGNPFTGFLGLALSPGKGLIWYVPIMVLLPWTFRRFMARSGRAGVLFAAMIATPILFYSTVLFWHGDPSWGPRYLYTALPYLTLPLGEILVSWRSRAAAMRLSFVFLVGASLAIQVAAVSVTQWRFWYHLEAQQQQSTNATAWNGQPFRWGAAHYHYYWNVRQSPLLIQFYDVYQVARLNLGDNAYRLTSPVDPWVHSNPAVDYAVNSFAFWWDDPLHPLLSAAARDLIAFALALCTLLVLAGIGLFLMPFPLAPGPPSGSPRSPRSAEASRADGSGAGQPVSPSPF